MKKVIYLTALGKAYVSSGMEAGADILRLVTSINAAADELGWKAAAVARYERPRIFTPEAEGLPPPGAAPTPLFSRGLKNFRERLDMAGIVRAYASKLEEYGTDLEQADLIHAWDTPAVLAFRKVSKDWVIKKPLLFTPEAVFCSQRPAWLDAQRRLALEKCDALVLPGAWACAGITDEYGYRRKCFTLPRGVEDFKYLRRGRVRRELGLKDTDILVCSMGRLSRESGFLTLVEAMALAVKAGNSALYCAIAGAGPEQEPLRARIGELGLASRVKLLGFRPDAGELLADAEIFAAPALKTMSDQGVIEAMRAGLAIVSSDASGNPEALGWGQAGHRFKAGDPAALCAALLRVAGSPTEMVYLSARAREFYSSTHSLTALATGAAKIYNSICVRPENR
ncbi:MAG: glycosyltransferase family 4 protein [Elusimicrobiales bacterium]|nr:glycosyltransferase family 4 protein [Elusimicrobiales bacterium]